MYDRRISAFIVTNATGFNVYVPHRKRHHRLRFSSFYIDSFICMRRNGSSNPMTCVEDTYRTLTAITFEAG